MADERFTALPTAEEYTLFREAYGETYPVRPLLNAIDAKDAEIARLRAREAELLARIDRISGRVDRLLDDVRRRL